MTTLLDTGPLLAAVDRDDKWHAQCVRLLEELPGPLLLPSTVLVEAASMINDRMGPDVHARFLDRASHDFRLQEITLADMRRMAQLVRKDRNLRLDPADASVIALAERLGVTQVATLDRRDFTVVRPGHVPAFTLLPA